MRTLLFMAGVATGAAATVTVLYRGLGRQLGRMHW